ncbi:SMI1/KNR4 family protein [Paenibacillus sp. 481]|uniref:SMI1/KNR4 family protein n=1 Tax=Paenibacillus sp. 481 TaxID=2835869 RepID=UPI001E5103FB|nr:SMI1/KNR4 family protein [Paenibacillus sp. 481]UHA72152.1 SMI1/KNR4 family protein [Paenibacillus sp. 481]
MKREMGQTVNNHYRTVDIVQGLKKRLNHYSLVVPNVCGTWHVARFTFHPPATTDQLRAFYDEYKYILHSDYIEFLKLHNGATLFSIGTDAGIEIFSLAQLAEQLERNSLHHLTIARNPTTKFCIRDTAEGLYLAGHNGWVNTYLPISFAQWLGHLIAANGADFWNWKIAQRTQA